MIDDVQVSFPRYDPRATGNLSRAPDLHLLFASKVFAVEGRFMARHVGMLLPQGEIVVVARNVRDVETVNHSPLNARRRSPLNASTRSVSTHRRGQFRTLQPCAVRLSSAATEAVAAARPLASGIKWDFTGAPVGCSFTTDTAMEEEAT